MSAVATFDGYQLGQARGAAGRDPELLSADKLIEDQRRFIDELMSDNRKLRTVIREIRTTDVEEPPPPGSN